jgi:hypothetical protein
MFLLQWKASSDFESHSRKFEFFINANAKVEFYMCLPCVFLEDAPQTAFIAVRRVQRRTAKTSLVIF